MCVRRFTTTLGEDLDDDGIMSSHRRHKFAFTFVPDLRRRRRRRLRRLHHRYCRTTTATTTTVVVFVFIPCFSILLLLRFINTQAMDLTRFPRRKYTSYVTPIEPMATLSSRLSSGTTGNGNGNGGVNLWIKRDDMLGLTGGGNKTRKLEFAMADAIINHGADTIVTCGAVQSNHCRLTLSACVKEGLKCVLVLEERVPGSYKDDASGNHYLFNLLGAENIYVVGLGEAPAKVEEVAAELREKHGRKVYCVPGGASNEIGALGYCSCAAEIQVRSVLHSMCVRVLPTYCPLFCCCFCCYCFNCFHYFTNFTIRLLT